MTTDHISSAASTADIQAIVDTADAREEERITYLLAHHDPQVVGGGELLRRLRGETERLTVLAARWADDPDHEYYGVRLFEAFNDDFGWDRSDDIAPQAG